MIPISGMANKHSSAINGTFWGHAADKSADAIDTPTPFSVDKAVTACSKLGSFLKAFFVSFKTVLSVFSLMR